MATQLKGRVHRLEGLRSAGSLQSFTVAELREAKRELEAGATDGPVSELVQRVASAIDGGKPR